MSSLASKCVFYRPEHSVNEGPLKLNFEGLGMERLNKPMGSAQRVDEKKWFICLVIMFSSRVMVIKMSKMSLFCIFCWRQQKNNHSFWAQHLSVTERSWVNMITRQMIPFFIYYLNSGRWYISVLHFNNSKIHFHRVSPLHYVLVIIFF